MATGWWKVGPIEDVFTRFDRIHECAEYTDGRTKARRRRPRLYTASRGKNKKSQHRESAIIPCFFSLHSLYKLVDVTEAYDDDVAGCRNDRQEWSDDRNRVGGKLAVLGHRIQCRHPQHGAGRPGLAAAGEARISSVSFARIHVHHLLRVPSIWEWLTGFVHAFPTSACHICDTHADIPCLNTT